MELLKEVIKRYLSKEFTDYALNIDGPWGGGKTHYIKRNMQDILEESGEFVLMYISLNGLNNLDNLIHMLKSSIFPYGIPNGIDNRILSSSPLKFIENNKKKVILCFDDLERIDEKCSIASVLGYINTNFIEHNNVKTIIISNSEEIEQKEKFVEIREKTIGRTIHFATNNLIVIESIINNYRELHKFYLRNNELMNGIFTAYDKINFRSIKFVFEIVEEIFSYLIDKDTSLEVKDDKLNDILLGIFVFCFVAGIEYKKGTIKNLKDGENILNPFQYHFNKKSEDHSNPVKELHKNNVIMNNLYRYYNSLVEFIVNGHFNKQKLINEIKEKYYVKKIEDISFEIIESYEHHELSTINESFPKVINALEEGYYNPLKYPYMYLVIREFIEKEYIVFQGSLEEPFLSGLEIAYEKSHVNVADERRFNRHFENCDEPTYVKLVTRLKEKRSLTIDQHNFSKIDEYIDALKRDDYSVISKSVDYFRSNANFFEYLSRKDVQKEFILLSNKSLNSFIVTLNQLYLRISNANEYYNIETPFMKEFQHKLTSELEASSGVDRLKKDQIINVISVIEKVINHLNYND